MSKTILCGLLFIVLLAGQAAIYGVVAYAWADVLGFLE